MKKSIIALSFIQNISNLLTSLPSRRLSSKLWPIPRHGFHDITRSFPLQTLLPFFLISSVQFVRNLAISPSNSRECHSVPDPDLEISGVGRSSRPLDKGKWGKREWSALRASVWSKNKRGRGRAPRWIRCCISLFISPRNRLGCTDWAAAPGNEVDR